MTETCRLFKITKEIIQVKNKREIITFETFFLFFVFYKFDLVKFAYTKKLLPLLLIMV